MSNRLHFYKMIHFLSFWQITTDFLQQNFLILPPDSDKIRPLYAFSGFSLPDFSGVSLPDFLRQQKRRTHSASAFFESCDRPASIYLSLRLTDSTATEPPRTASSRDEKYFL